MSEYSHENFIPLSGSLYACLPCTLMDDGSSQAVLEAQKESSEVGDVGELVEFENSCILDQLQGSDAVQE